MKEQKIYNGKLKIKIDDRHRYWVEEKRIENSVTGITGIIDKSPALMGWAIKMMSEYLLGQLVKEVEITEEIILRAKKEYRSAQKEATDIGTAIHEWIEKWIKGEEYEIPDDEKIQNGIMSFLKWQKEHKIKFNKENSERLVYSKKYNYVGTLDAIAEIDGKKVIVDFKSSNGLYNEYRYQLAGYWNAYEEEFGKTFDYGIIVQFDKKTGNFNPVDNIIEIPREDYKKDLKAFLGLLNAKKRERELKK